MDAGDFLKLISQLKVNLVLCGHKHVPWFWKLNGILMINAGTATTRRTKARVEASFNVIKIEEERNIFVERLSSRTFKKELIYNGVI